MEQVRIGLMSSASLATNSLPSVRYNKRMLNFLCHQMTQVPIAFQNVPKDAPKDVLDILKEAMKAGTDLVKSHAKKFNIRTFYKVDRIAHRVEELCNTFSGFFNFLGMEPDPSLQTKLDIDWVEGDRRYMDWYLACVLEGHSVDRELSSEENKDLLEVITEHRHRMQFVKLIEEAEIQLKDQIDEGGYGVVFKGIWKGNDVAIKRLRKDLTLEARAEFYTEIELQVQMKHKNVVRCHGATPKNTMVLELGLMNLRKLIQQETEIAWLEKLHLMLSASEGVKHLHDSGLIHRDIKSENFLIFESLDASRCIVKIGDFGLTTVKVETRSRTNRPLVGTVSFVAPEIHDGTPHHFMTDVFSFGLVLFEIASASYPYRGLITDAQLENWKKNKKDPCVLPDDCPDKLADLMRSCIEPDCKRRPTITQVRDKLKDMFCEVGHIGFSAIVCKII